MSQLVKTAIIKKYQHLTVREVFNPFYTSGIPEKGGAFMDELDVAIRNAKLSPEMPLEDAIPFIEAAFFDEWDSTLEGWFRGDYKSQEISPNYAKHPEPTTALTNDDRDKLVSEIAAFIERDRYLKPNEAVALAARVLLQFRGYQL